MAEIHRFVDEARCYLLPGDRLEEAAQLMADHARASQETVYCTFNGFALSARPGDSAAWVADYYRRELRRERFAGAAAPILREIQAHQQANGFTGGNAAAIDAALALLEAPHS